MIRQKAVLHPLGSTPLSYLFEASVDIDRLLALFRMVTGSKYALSTNRLFVESVTAVLKPPITPARAMG